MVVFVHPQDARPHAGQGHGGIDVVHGVNVYRAVSDKVETLAAFAHDFGRRVMELDEPLPVNMFTGSKLVNDSELAELEQLLHDWPADKE
ncbi:hypothetical protein [Pseudoduganella armeniaca]|uniref:hypothetical protein n=1 Tax=Pseudoduganella armeniaca TaxID=2072590 RepID=UPI001E29A949|nr:hypothetical protein [Pseudoduganella armeniaca]